MAMNSAANHAMPNPKSAHATCPECRRLLCPHGLCRGCCECAECQARIEFLDLAEGQIVTSYRMPTFRMPTFDVPGPREEPDIEPNIEPDIVDSVSCKLCQGEPVHTLLRPCPELLRRITARIPKASPLPMSLAQKSGAR